MGKAFVAKLAKEGARDPEALAAWIGRNKHGGKAFAKLAAVGRKKSRDDGRNATAAGAKPAQRAKRRNAFPKQAAAQAAPKVEPRDKDRGFHPDDKHLPMQRRRLVVPDDERGVVRSQIAMLQLNVENAEALGAPEAAARARRELQEKERQLADADYARETLAGDAHYGRTSQAGRDAAREAVRKAQQTDDPKDWEAAADAADAFSRQASQSPYGHLDAGWYRNEAKNARTAAVHAREKQARQAARKAERTLPPPKPGETPVAHVEFLDEEGMRSFGDPELGRRAISRSSDATAMPDTGAEGHESALNNVSPAFRKKVAEARASGRPWLHHISHDSDGAAIHKLQVMTPGGKQQTTTFLERNTKAWKAKEQQLRASR
jgi:hypothetical protein